MMSVPWVLSRLEICPHHADDTIWQKQREKEEKRKREGREKERCPSQESDWPWDEGAVQ
jgi:hypothetical protein